jgi:DnaK suppressor protein
MEKYPCEMKGMREENLFTIDYIKGKSNKMTFEKGINSQQVEYFRRRLMAWRDELLSESGETACHSGKGIPIDVIGLAANAANKQSSSQSPDDRKQKLTHKIDETLQRIKAGTYRA